MRRSRSGSPRRNDQSHHRGRREHRDQRSANCADSSFGIRISSFSEYPCHRRNPWLSGNPLLVSVASVRSVVKRKAEKIVIILLESGGANQIQARDVQLERSLMKRIPHTLGNIEQKETKLTKVGFFWQLPRILVFFVAFCFTLICFSFIRVTSFAQTPDSAAEREVQRRQAAIPQGEAALARGKSAMKAKNYTIAHEEFRTAVTYLPDAVASGETHDQAVDGFCKSGVALAEARIAEGRNADAEAILSEILSDRYDPKCRSAHVLYTRLRQPGSFDKTVRTVNNAEIDCAAMLARPFSERVERVKELLAEADSSYQSGRYDLAMKRYDQVLCLDPYNTAARRGQEKVNNTKYQYGEEAYNETRSRQLWKVEEAWQQPVRKYGATGAPVAVGAQRELGGTALVSRKLNSIIIPHIEFRDATIREAIEVLREQAAENDTGPEGQRGVNIVLRLVPLGQIAPPSMPAVPPALPNGTGTPAAGGGAPPTGGPAAGGAPAAPGAPPGGSPGVPAVAPVSGPANARITVTLDNIPLGEALRYIANQAGLKVKVEPYAISVIPLSEQSNDLITKRYHVPPEFFGGPLDVGYYLTQSLSGGQQGQTGNATSVPPVSGKILEQEQYTAATSAEYTAASQTQGVAGGYTNAGQSTYREHPGGTGTSTTRQQLFNDRQLVGRADARTMLESMGVAFPPGANATFWPHSGTLIIRNTQDNLDFVDALVDQANASQPKQVSIESKFIEINQNNLKELGFDWLLGPFSLNGKVFGAGGTAGNQAPVNAANFPFVDPATGKPIGQNPATSGNRSGNFAITANALDALLMPGLGQVAGVAPGIFGLSGVFTNPQFQVVVRALNQKKGIDLLSAPSVTTKSGQRAVIEVVREFRYPKTYTQPQVPSITSSTSTIVGASTVVPVVVAPTTPQDWETRNTG